RLGRKLIPWADGKTIVAAKNAVSHERPVFAVDMAFVFDRKIGDTPARIEDVGARKSSCRADIEARPAASAMVAFRRVRRKSQIDKNRTQEQPRAKLPGNEIAVLAGPAKTRRLRKRLFHNGRGIDKDLEFHALGLRGKPRAKLFESALDQPVIVAVSGVDGDVGCRFAA